jgi:hypothetical protein
MLTFSFASKAENEENGGKCHKISFEWRKWRNSDKIRSKKWKIKKCMKNHEVERSVLPTCQYFYKHLADLVESMKKWHEAYVCNPRKCWIEVCIPLSLRCISIGFGIRKISMACSMPIWSFLPSRRNELRTIYDGWGHRIYQIILNTTRWDW